MGSALIKDEPGEACQELGMAPPAPSAPSAAPQSSGAALVAAVEGDAAGSVGAGEAGGSRGEEAAPGAAAAVVRAPAPHEQQQLALSNSLLLDIKNALLDVKDDMGAYRQEADEMKDTMRAMRDEQESLKAELAALKTAQQAQQAQQAPAGSDVQGQLLAALLGNSPMGTMLAGMLAGGSAAAKKPAAGKRKAAAATGGGAAKKRGAGGGGAAAAAAAVAAAAEAEAQKRAAALRQKKEPWVVERADGTRGTWPADVADEELQQMLDDFQEAPLKVAISYTRVAQSPHFRHKVLAVPHKKSADGERLYYIMRASLVSEATKRGLAV